VEERGRGLATQDTAREGVWWWTIARAKRVPFHYIQRPQASRVSRSARITAPCVVRRFRKKLTPRTPARNDGRPHRPRRERLKSLNAVKRSTPKCTPLTPSPWYRTRRTPASP
jgi:hypothetical protein